MLVSSTDSSTLTPNQVRYCNAHSHRFLAQSGGHGWATTFDMDPNDVIINLRGLNSVVISDDGSTISAGGGALNDEFIEAAYDAGVQVLNGGCNCVGVLGATLWWWFFEVHEPLWTAMR